MPLQKQPVPVNFSKGLDTKTDPKQIQLDNFSALKNSVFSTTGQLTKRDGFKNKTNLPNALQTTLTTLNEGLIATGSELYSFDNSTDQWIDQGTIQPVNLEVLSLVRSNTSQINADAAVSSNGLTCLAYMDAGVSYYQIVDVNGNTIVQRTTIPASGINPRVFLLGQYFIVTFMALNRGAPQLDYIAIPISMPSSPRILVTIDTTLASQGTGYDGYVVNNNLYLAWSGSSSTIRMKYITSGLVVSNPTTISSHTATLMSVTADTSGSSPVIWVSFWDSSSTNGFTCAFNSILSSILAPTQIITSKSLKTITSAAQASLNSIFYEVLNHYNDTGGYPTAIQTDYINSVTCTISGTLDSMTLGGGTTTILRSVGLASKAFIDDNSVIRMLVAYGETNQPTYFLIDNIGKIYMRLAYGNGGGYASTQVIPSVSKVDSNFFVPYLIKDFLTTVNKGTDLPSGTPVNAIYTQTGVNLAKMSINSSGQYSNEIASALHLTGGQLWEYDGFKPVEHGFQVWPENVAIQTSTSGGLLTAQTYFYSFTYEWTDNQGNLHRSAPSIPISQVTTGSTSSNTIYVPTLRLTYKTGTNPVRIVGYRWSTAQQVYYQFTSITSPTLNDTAVDYVTFVDTLADSAILGNPILYTTGGVIENIAAPANSTSTMYKSRLFLIDAEDRNLLWYSKQVIENTPVEFSDLLTIYVAPTIGAQQSTGNMTALGAMDDKLVIFKSNAIYYVTGNGPDNTGANNDFSDPIFITGAVGTTNPASVVLIPSGLMFQSDKGIWLLGRGLNTDYIGAPVEAFNQYTVLSAKVIPGTTQVRFIMSNGITLMYDYFYNQWGEHSNVSAISSTIFEGKHTYLNSYGQVLQETPGFYLDGSVPVLLGLTTAWINLAGLQGFERFYFFYLLGTYFSPFTLNIQIAYDYNPSPTQSITVTPDNYSATWGRQPPWGSPGGWGGPGNVFEARIFPQNQKCQAFQLTITEVYDPSFGVPAGEGLSLSGLNMVIGTKKGYRTQKSARSFG